MPFLQVPRFRIVEFNVENLFVLMDHDVSDPDGLSEEQWQKLSVSLIPNKPLRQVREIARAIQDLDPDVLMLCEVGGLESLRNFNRLFLRDAYIPHLIEGNSDRGIDLGYLVRKSLPLRHDLFSHKQRPIDFLYPHERLTRDAGYDDRPAGRITSHRFSRDVLELRLFEREAPEPALILMLAHLKSQLDPDRIDPYGRDRRKAELEKLVEIYKEAEAEFEGRVPVVVGGDFNGLASLSRTDPEFAAIYRETELRDALEVAGVPPEERFTHMQIHPYVVSSVNRQLDYLFVPPSLQDWVDKGETFVYRFTDEFGMTLAAPRTLSAKRLLPSDHYPVVLTLRKP